MSENNLTELEHVFLSELRNAYSYDDRELIDKSFSVHEREIASGHFVPYGCSSYTYWNVYERVFNKKPALFDFDEEALENILRFLRELRSLCTAPEEDVTKYFRTHKFAIADGRCAPVSLGCSLQLYEEMFKKYFGKLPDVVVKGYSDEPKDPDPILLGIIGQMREEERLKGVQAK